MCVLTYKWLTMAVLKFPLLAKRVYASKQILQVCFSLLNIKIGQKSRCPLQTRHIRVRNSVSAELRRKYGVPKSTLQDTVSGKVLPGSKRGKRRYLSEQEEEELVDFFG